MNRVFGLAVLIGLALLMSGLGGNAHGQTEREGLSSRLGASETDSGDTRGLRRLRPISTFSIRSSAEKDTPADAAIQESDAGTVRSSMAVCGSASLAGGKLKGCIGTDGVSTSGGYGIVDTKRQHSWDGEGATCVGASAGGGKVGYATGGSAVCVTDSGKTYSEFTGGGGVGAGMEGAGHAAVTLEVTAKTDQPPETQQPGGLGRITSFTTGLSRRRNP